MVVSHVLLHNWNYTNTNTYVCRQLEGSIQDSKTRMFKCFKLTVKLLPIHVQTCKILPTCKEL